MEKQEKPHREQEEHGCKPGMEISLQSPGLPTRRNGTNDDKKKSWRGSNKRICRRSGNPPNELEKRNLHEFVSSKQEKELHVMCAQCRSQISPSIKEGQTSSEAESDSVASSVEEEECRRGRRNEAETWTMRLFLERSLFWTS